MTTFTEDTKRLFNDVQNEIAENIRNMMAELWLTWSHLGMDDEGKAANIRRLVIIEKDLHHDVICETRQKLRKMELEVEELKKETQELSENLSIDISILEFKDGVTLIEYKKELENNIADYREQMKQRKLKIERLMEWQRDLVDKLGVSMMEMKESPLPSEDDLDKLTEQMEILQSERDKRVETFLNTQLEIKDIMEQLQIKPTNKFEHAVVTSLSVDFKVTDFNMDRLNKLRQDLQEKFEQTNNRVLELREKLTRLWDCLEEDMTYQDHFLQAHRGCHPQTELAIREEIKRCEVIKRQKIQVFVANVRTKIKLMWDNLMFANEDRDFIHYYQDIFSEDTLTLHEMYLDELNKQYNEYRHIYDLVNTRNDLWSKKKDLEQRASEPGRYHNRGGQLLREERERKAIDNNLPKIEDKLRELATEYEIQTGKIFRVNGRSLVQMIDEDWEAYKTVRQNKVQSARAQALTPRATAQIRKLATSPMTKRNRTADIGARRLLVTGSATKAVSTTQSNSSALKRSAITTIKRRMSGRLATRALIGDAAVKRRLEYEPRGTPKANGSILKYKRNSHGKRRSAGRRSGAHMTEERNAQPQNPLLETTQSTYSDFKAFINQEKTSRSSLANTKHDVPSIMVTQFAPLQETKTPQATPNKKPRLYETPNSKYGKENLRTAMTPKANIMKTPSRLTRSSVKMAHDGFATPRTPLFPIRN